MASQEVQTFAEAFQDLRDIAAALREQQEPDIDQLAPMVEKANCAYKVCKERIEATQKALKEMLGDEAAPQ